LIWLQVKTRILGALAHRLFGETALATATLEEALVRAQPVGYVRIFVDEGPPMADALREVRAGSGTREYVAALRSAVAGEL
jgi:LuxR family maltose regulon positive regulatory protein